MSSYDYRCFSCKDETERDYPIGTAPRLLGCEECGGRSQLVIGAGVQIAPSALEGKGAKVRQLNGKDRALRADMDSYKRMRYRGLQPERIDGASKIENEVNDSFDIVYKDRLTKVAPTEPWDSIKQRAQEGLEAVKA